VWRVQSPSQPGRGRLGCRRHGLATEGANLEPDPGLASRLLRLVNLGRSNDVKQESRSRPVGVGYHPPTKK
jgi:hypothetical protein